MTNDFQYLFIVIGQSYIFFCKVSVQICYPFIKLGNLSSTIKL